jgi:uncharacterized membrane-anchored protein
VIEVYSAAALRRWKLEFPGYKRETRPRALIVAALAAALPELKLAGAADTMGRSADALDALVAALVARAGALGLVDLPPADQAEVALIKGWIWMPAAGSLGQLSAPQDR